MRRLAHFDVADRSPTRLARLAAQAAFGLGCTGAAVLLRLAIDLVAPTAGPFALIYPAILISTLYGRWQAGLITYVTTFLWAWWFILPVTGSFTFANSTDGPRTVVNGVCALVILLFAEIFRGAGRNAVAQRDLEIRQRELLLRELDHRTKNNFTIVVSLLELQRNRQTSDEAREALSTAANRIHSFASAHEALYEDRLQFSDVPMAAYLRNLTTSVTNALFLPGRVRIELDLADVRLPRDQAVSIGLVLNEVLTNAAKHAFAPDADGLIEVRFELVDESWRLTVADNGVGPPAEPSGRRGLGSSLIAAFAARAGGEVKIESLLPGTRVTLSGRRAA